MAHENNTEMPSQLERLGSLSVVGGSVEAAQEKLMQALAEYTALLPKQTEPTSQPIIEPRLMHTSPDSFRLGYNMHLDAGGYMPGKVPVIVVPARPEDLRQYSAKGCSVKRLMARLLNSPNAVVSQPRGQTPE